MLEETYLQLLRTSSNDIRRRNKGTHHSCKEQSSSRTNNKWKMLNITYQDRKTNIWVKEKTKVTDVIDGSETQQNTRYIPLHSVVCPGLIHLNMILQSNSSDSQRVFLISSLLPSITLNNILMCSNIPATYANLFMLYISRGSLTSFNMLCNTGHFGSSSFV